MAKNNRHNTAFVVGSVVGAMVGAAAALWKTPYTGEELRTKITGGRGGSTEVTAGTRTVDTGSQSVVARPAQEPVRRGMGGRSVKDKVLAGVEKTLAPIVGVELGKTANGRGAKKEAGDVRVHSDLTQDTTTARATTTMGASTTSPSQGATGDASMGLSRDRVDAEEWADAYGSDTSSTRSTTTQPPASGASSTMSSSQASTGTSQASAAQDSESDYSQTLMGQSRERFSAERWASAYGSDAGSGTTTERTSSDSTTGASREPSRETDRGADPAFRGDDGDLERHAPIERGTTENVAPAAQDDPRSRNEPDEGPGAASIDQLTTPQTDKVPDAIQQTGHGAMHPFPKLGGKEN